LLGKAEKRPRKDMFDIWNGEAERTLPREEGGWGQVEELGSKKPV